MKRILMVVLLGLLMISFSACSVSSIPIVGDSLQGILDNMADESNIVASSSDDDPERENNVNNGGKDDVLSQNTAARESGITLSNEGEVGVYIMHISPTTSSEWGDDVLGSDVLGVGDQLTVPLSDGDMAYDLQVEYDDGSLTVFPEVYLENGYTLRIYGGTQSPAVETLDAQGTSVGIFSAYSVEGDDMQSSDGGADGTVTLVNGSGESVWYAYITQSGSSEWSEDLLSTGILDDTQEISIALPYGSGEYDLQLENEFGETYTFYGLLLDPSETLLFTLQNGGTIEHYLSGGDLYTTLTAGSGSSGGGTLGGGTGAENAEVTFGNGLSEDVFRLYMSRSDDTSWGEDLLGSEILYAGDVAGLMVEDGVDYDIMIEFEDGSTAEFYQLTLFLHDSLYLTQSNGTYIIEVADANGSFSGEYVDASAGAYTNTNTQYYGPT